MARSNPDSHGDRVGGIRKWLNSPTGLLTILAICLFLAELISMFVMALIPTMPSILSDIIDGIILVALALPALRVFAFTPLSRQLRAREEGERRIMEVSRKLEQRVEDLNKTTE